MINDHAHIDAFQVVVLDDAVFAFHPYSAAGSRIPIGLCPLAGIAIANCGIDEGIVVSVELHCNEWTAANARPDVNIGKRPMVWPTDVDIFDCRLVAYRLRLDRDIGQKRRRTTGNPRVPNYDLIKEGDIVEVLYNTSNDQPLQCEIDTHVILQITYTEPGVKGDTATNASKPATLETGAEIRVPLFINEGDLIKIDTRTRSYVERVKQ